VRRQPVPQWQLHLDVELVPVQLPRRIQRPLLQHRHQRVLVEPLQEWKVHQHSRIVQVSHLLLLTSLRRYFFNHL
jgi:hypothetical protein